MTAGGWWGSSRGWGDPPPWARETDEEREARRARDLAEDQARIETARAGLFGNPADPSVESLTLPNSGWTLEWRSDGYWRERPPGSDDDEEWAPCDGECFMISGANAGDEDGVGATAMAWGTADPTEPVTCRRLITDAPIAVHRLGWLWAVDWDGTFSGATVQVGDHEWLWQVFGSF